MDKLKRSDQSDFADLIGTHSDKLSVLEKDFTLVRLDKSADDIEQGRLAGSVWSYDSNCFSLKNFKRNVMERLQTSEGFGDVCEVQRGVIFHLYLAPYSPAPLS